MRTTNGAAVKPNPGRSTDAPDQHNPVHTPTGTVGPVQTGPAAPAAPGSSTPTGAPTKPIANGVQRSVYTAGNQQLPDGQLGTVVRTEGQPATGDPAADDAYDSAGIVYDFYNQVLGRNSLDDKGMGLKSTVHFGKNFDNAYWDGTHMTYGDGDGKQFSGFSDDLSVVAHEMTHGVTENTANLNYRSQPGALNESWSDVMGDIVRQWHTQSAADFASVDGAKKADWLIGDDCFTPGVAGDALRSLAAPGTAYKGDPQPGTMAGYKAMKQDNGGVHINSGIPNHAGYLVAQAIGSLDTAKIWYKTMSTYLKPNSQFIDAANDTVRAATDLFGANSAQVIAVQQAWTAVGLTPTMRNSARENHVDKNQGFDSGIVPPWMAGRSSLPPQLGGHDEAAVAS